MLQQHLSPQVERSSTFFNPVNHTSMRLTRTGFSLLTKHLKVETYEFNLTKAISPKVLLQLERQLRSPYFIVNLKKVIVFDETTAIMLQLHGSDLETYLNNLEQHQ